MDNVILMDLGNTRIKIYSNGDSKYFHYKTTDEDEFYAYLNSLPKNPIIFSSVNPRILTILKNYLKNEFHDASKLIAERQSYNFENIQGMGTDRKLSLIGAHQLSSNNVITIDCGTAITINYMEKEGKCLGGFIMPGLDTQSMSLHKFTGSLPNVKVEDSEFKLGENTEDAIQSAILFGTSGSIKNLIELSIQHYRIEDFDIYLTGGYSELINNTLRDWNYSVILKDDLVLQGLKAISNQENT